MTRIGAVLLLVAAAVVPAALAGSQELPGSTIPIGQQFVVVSLNGYGLGGGLLTLTVTRNQSGPGYWAAGFAGCNAWTGRVDFGIGDWFDIDGIGTTRKFCANRMKIENDYLAALQAVTRWRMEGPRLVLTGDRTTLVLRPVSRRAGM